MEWLQEHIPHPKSIMRYVLTLLPLPLWLITYRPSWLLRDVVAGLAVGLVMIPQSIVYARFANVTTAHGLYTSFAGLLLYFFLGSSKNIAVSATAIGSLLMGHNIHVIILKLGVGMYTAEEVAHGITIFAGFICFVFGALKLSRLVGLVPPVAVNAFTTATCIKVMMTQLPVLLGLRGVSTRGPPYVTIIGIFRYISHMRIDAAFGISTIVVLVAFGRLCAIMAKRQTTKKQFWDCFASFRLPITVGLSTIISYIINHSHDPSTSPFSLVGYIEPGTLPVPESLFQLLMLFFSSVHRPTKSPDSPLARGGVDHSFVAEDSSNHHHHVGWANSACQEKPGIKRLPSGSVKGNHSPRSRQYAHAFCWRISLHKFIWCVYNTFNGG